MTAPILSPNLLLTLASLAVLPAVSSATDFLWGNADGTWNTTSGNTPWNGQSWVDDNTAVFHNSTDVAITVEGTVRPAAMEVSGTGNVTLDGGTIDFGNNTGMLNGRASESSAGTLTLNSVLAGTGGLQIGAAGHAGTVILSGANTYTGATTIGDNATLRIAGTGSLGGGNYADSISSSGTLQFSSATAQKLTGAISLGGRLVLDNNNLTLAGTSRSQTQTVNAAISGSGTLNATGGGNIRIGGSESNTNTGGIKIDLTGSAWGAAGSGSFVYLGKTGGAVAIADNAVLEISGTGNNSIIMLEDNQFGAGAVINFSSANGSYARTDLAGTDQALAGITSGSLDTMGGGVIQNDGSYNVSAGESTLTLNGDSHYLFHGHFRDVENNATDTADKLNLVKDGSGTQVLAGNRIYYSGTTDIRGGTLEFANVTSSSKLVSAITVRTGATLKYSNSVGSIIQNKITLDGGTVLFSTTNDKTELMEPSSLGGSGTLVKEGANRLIIRSTSVALDGNSLIDVQSGILMNDYMVTDWSNNQAEMRLGETAILDLRGVKITVGALNGSGNIVNSSSRTDVGNSAVHGSLLTIGAGNGSGVFTGNIVGSFLNPSSGSATSGNSRKFIDLHKVGTGTQVFAGHHNGSVITIDGGTFQLGNSSGNGTTDASSIVNNATFKVANDSAQTLSSAISGSGDFVKSGTGVLTLNNKNTYTGDTRIESGTLRLGSSSLASGTTVMPFGDSITYGSGGTNAGYRGFLYSLLSTGSDFQFVGERTDTPGNLPADQINHAGISGDRMDYQIEGGVRHNLLEGRVAMQPDAVLIHFGVNDINQGSGETDQGVLKARISEIVDTFLNDSPNSTVFLAQLVPATYNTWTEATVDAFNLTLADVVAERQANGESIVLVDLNTDYPENSLPDKLHPNDAGYVWMAQQWYNALMENMGEQETEALPTGTNVSINATGTLDLDGHIATIGKLSGAGNVTLGNGALILNSSENASFDGVISGSGALVKTGTGTQTLGGSNSFTGGTLVTGGTLLVNGSLASGVEVQHGATLGGNGLIKGNITVLSGGTISPGNSIDTLTIEGNVELAAGAKLLIEIGDGGAHDIIAFLGSGNTFTFADGAELVVTNIGSGGDISGNYQIFSGDVTINGPLQFTDGSHTYTLDSSGNLHVAAIPEPGTYALFGTALFGGLAILRRRSKKARPE